MMHLPGSGRGPAARLAAVALLLWAGPALAAEPLQPQRVPFQYGKGKQAFEKLCSECHGQWGGGSDQGPPLMHPYYKPSHHSDRAFVIAIRRGTRQHHWNFGDMKPVPEASDRDVGAIIQYVRWLQAQNGIQ